MSNRLRMSMSNIISLLLIKVTKLLETRVLCIERIAKKRFSRFRGGELELTNSSRSDRPVQFDENQFYALIKKESLGN